MKVNQGLLDLSASDVSSAFGCRHRTALDLAVARKERPAATYFDLTNATLQVRGIEHEKGYVAELERRGRTVCDLRSAHGEVACSRQRRSIAGGPANERSRSSARAGAEALTCSG
jgi:hypothetical protein